MIRRFACFAAGVLLAASGAFAADPPPAGGTSWLQQHGTLSGEATRLALADTLFNPGHRLYGPPLDGQLIRLADDAVVSLPAELNLTSKLAAEWDRDNVRQTTHLQL